MSLVTDDMEGDGGTLLGLAELDNEVDVSSIIFYPLSLCHFLHVQDLTQYNTAHNRQISTIGISLDEPPRKRQHRRNASVTFCETEEVINPGGVELPCLSSWFTCCPPTEDVDPSIGKFRNMIQSSVVPAKVTLYV